jgi:hypothetical protein
VRGDARKEPLQLTRVTAVIFHQHIHCSVECAPRIKAAGGLLAELREPSRQRKAGTDPQTRSQGASPHVHLVAEPVPVGGSY